MPELPDIEVYVHCLRQRLVGRAIDRLRVQSPFVLRSIEPEPEAVVGREVRAVARLGKRIVLELGGMAGQETVRCDAMFVVIHLMIAGRFHWRDDPVAKGAGRITLATLHTAGGTLILTEAGTVKRAGLWVVSGRERLMSEHAREGLDLLDPGLTVAAFAARLRETNHTLKRAMVSPRLIDGVGNAYSDEILHAARVSPFVQTGRLSDGEYASLLAAARRVLSASRDMLLERFRERFPGTGDITAFRPEFAAHGKYRQPCPVCGTAIQRIVYAENEANYCPKCQTGGRVLADRSLSRLLKDDWPRTVEEFESL